jgi:predicted transposase YbfD/YdcC
MNDPERRQLAIFCFFQEVPDPRVERTRRHSLMDVLVIALLTMICVGEGWEDMEEFGQAKMLDVRGATVTVDAMGCQREIAKRIVELGADYVMGLKGNQGTARKEVESFFSDAMTYGFRDVQHSFHETVDRSEHGRMEVRRIWTSQQLDWFEDLPKWTGLRSVILVESERTVAGETSTERRYYWSSHAVNAEVLAGMIRGHWSIENQLHWCLDVGFNEDQSRIRTDHGPENIALLRKVAMNLAKSERTHKRGIQAKRKLAAWNDEYLIKLLQAGLPEKPIK